MTVTYSQVDYANHIYNRSESYGDPAFLLWIDEHCEDPLSCPSSPVSAGGTVLTYCDDVILPESPAMVCEILITINFPDMPYPYGSQLYLGLTNSTDDILAGAKPIDIVPGAILHGLVSILVKQQISNQQAATFGIPQVGLTDIVEYGLKSFITWW